MFWDAKYLVGIFFMSIPIISAIVLNDIAYNIMLFWSVHVYADGIFTDIEPVEDCLVSMVNGSVKVNQNQKRVTIQFSSDSGSLITYKCKLDNRNFKDCELIT